MSVKYTVSIELSFETDDELTKFEKEFLNKEIFDHCNDFSPTNMDIEVESINVSSIKQKH